MEDVVDKTETTDNAGWKRGSINRRIFSAILTIGALSLVAKLLAFAKDLIVAPRFGLGDVLDAYFVATLLPTFAVNIAAAPITSALIPTYIELRMRGGAASAHRLFANVMTASLVVMGLVTAALALAFPYVVPIVASSFSEEKAALTYRLFLCVLPMVALNGVTLIWSAILNAGEHFALAALTPVITPLLVLVVVLAGPEAAGIYLLVAGLTFGAALEMIIVGIGVWQRGISVWPRWHGLDDSTRQVIRQYAPMVGCGLVMGSTPLIDQAVAATLGPGSVSALSYGNKIIIFVLGILSTALGTAVLPYFARMAAVEDWQGLRSSFRSYTGLLAAVTIPLTAAMILASEPVIRLLFERGNFTSAQTSLVSNVQICYLLQVPFYIPGILAVRVLTAFKMNGTILAIATANTVLDVILVLTLPSLLGVSGVALSTSLVYAFSCTACFIAVSRQARKRGATLW